MMPHRIQIDQGSINLRLREVPPGGVRLLTPHATVMVSEAGRYHLDVAAPQGSEPSNHTRVAVLAGAARIEGLAAPLTVNAGHSATMRAGELNPAGPGDRPAARHLLERGVSRCQAGFSTCFAGMTGVQELENGASGSRTDYGAVWYPRSMADCAPIATVISLCAALG
jgi:hypothetical protein